VRVECPSCHAVVSPALAINSSQADVGMTCSHCGKTIPADVLKQAETDDEVAMTTPIPTTKSKVCAKCSTPLRDGAEACPSCGLVVAKMASYAETEAQVSEPIKAAWDSVMESWDDEARHDKLFRLVAEAGEYTWAATRYREQSRTRPADSITTKQQEKIKRALEATLLVSSTRKEKADATPYKGTVMLLGILIIMMVLGGVYMFIKSKNTKTEDPPPPPPSGVVSPQVR
jgi:uncharacterized Zn finger protein (UPF0148 family)